MKNSYNKYYRFLIIAFFIIQFLPVVGQQTVKIATKTIKKDLKYTNQQITIKGEKSKIFVTKVPIEAIQIEVKLISKNPDVNKAKRDLGIMKYSISENSKNVIVSNYFESDKYREITSNLSAVIEIKIPDGARIYISNIYGNVVVENIECISQIKNSFGETRLNKCSGKFNIELYYNNLNCKKLSGELICNAERTILDFTDVSGDFSFRTKYGKIRLETNSKYLQLNVEASRTEVSLYVPGIQYYIFFLDTKFSEINVPDGLIYQTKFIPQGSIIDTNKPLINIGTSYCPITIKEIENEK